MNLPVRHTSGRLAELPFPGWTRDPPAEFDDLFSRMESLLESTFGAAPAVTATAWSPLADFSETDDAYLIEVDVPGIKRDDIDIELSDRDLIISGEIKHGGWLVEIAHTRRWLSLSDHSLAPLTLLTTQRPLGRTAW